MKQEQNPNHFYRRIENPINPKVKAILDLDREASTPIVFKHYSRTVNDYIHACKDALVQGVRQDMNATRDPILCGNNAYNKVEVFKPVFAQMAQDPESDPEDAELLYSLSIDWIRETLLICQKCPAVTDPRRCTGLCVKWGVVPK